MRTSDENRLELPAYVAGELEAEQRTALEQHLAECGDCRAELAEIKEAAELAALLPYEFQPPRRLEERTFALLDLERQRSTESNGRQAVEGENNVRSLRWDRPRGRFSIRTLVAPGLAAAFVAMGVLSMSLWTRTTDLQNQLTEAQSQSSSGESAALVELTSQGDTRVSADARLVSMGNGNYRVVLSAEDLPAPPNGYHYELWLGSGDGWTSAGSFTSGGSDSTFEFQTSVDPLEFSIIDVTLEPINGQPARDGKDVVRGEIDISELRT